MQRLSCSAILATAWLTLASMALAQTPRVAEKPTASQIVQRALDVMGGLSVIERVHVIKTDEHRTTFHLADSEHSQPPYLPDYGSVTQWIDVSVPAFRADSTLAAATGDQVITTQIAREGWQLTRTTFNGQTSPARIRSEQVRWQFGNPLLVLLAASRRADLRLLPSQPLYGIEHQRVEFDDRGHRVTLWINRFNDHLAAVDILATDPWDMFWNEWGDVTQRVTFSDYHYEAAGLHYPHQWNIYFNGELQEMRSVDRLTVNPDTASVDITVPQEGRPVDPDKSKWDNVPLGRADRPIVELAPGVVQIPGSWYVTLVRQSDGIVVIDAPISNGYSAKVIEEAGRRFPELKIKALVTTTNYWWHIAGVREYAARGITIVAADQNVPLIRKLLSSPHTLAPDSLQKSGVKPVVEGIRDSKTIGTGENRIVVYPIRAATAQMLMTWLPESKLLHTAEMAQPLGPNGSFLFPESLLELQRAVAANGLRVENVIGMHMSPTPWSKVAEAIRAAEQHGENP